MNGFFPRIIFICFFAFYAFEETSAQVNPVPTPAPPLPPPSNPAATPDTAAIRFVPPAAPNQPAPATITPAPRPFPKSDGDTVFRDLDEPKSPFKTDSTNRPKK